MAQSRYIVRMEDGELFPFLEAWLKIPGMVEYDPAVHGYRSEVAAQMGLPDPAPVPVAVQKPEVVSTKSKAGDKAGKDVAAKGADSLSDIFNAK